MVPVQSVKEVIELFCELRCPFNILKAICSPSSIPLNMPVKQVAVAAFLRSDAVRQATGYVAPSSGAPQKHEQAARSPPKRRKFLGIREVDIIVCKHQQMSPSFPLLRLASKISKHEKGYVINSKYKKQTARL